MPATLVHLVRHGEVENPHGVVYASIPGFGLSRRGREQAEAAASHLANRNVAGLWTSPLDRAVETAGAFAKAFDREARVDARLTEWGLGERWSGIRWDDLEERFPGEMDAYFSHPRELDFSPETLDGLARRVTLSVAEASVARDGDVVLVSHQDPIQAARLALTGRPLESLQRDKPGHASIVTLRRDGDDFTEVSYWEPEQGPSFPPAADR